ncbi:MAG: A24 family peptidase [Phycisphaerae bacterium]|jgi:prepilin peptidase CpaA|nr:A24 family peptidase [Phycisphaerae bacterium]
MPPLQAEMWAYGVLLVVLVAAAIDDVCTRKIHNWITYPAVLAGLIGHCCFGGFDLHRQPLGLSGSLIGLLVGFGPMFIAWRAGGVGGGDAKLMAAVGALAGWEFTLASLFYGFAIAGVMAVFVMLRHRIMRRTLGRVWRFVMQLMMRTKPGDPGQADSPTIALGLALAIGATLELVDIAFGGPVTSRLFGAGGW